MAEFTRLPTDSYMDFLASHVSLSENTAKLGLLKVDNVKNRLFVNTSKVDRFIQLNDLDRDNRFRNARIIEILANLFNSVVDRQGKALDSRIGVQEVLLVAEESDFVNRRTNNGDTLQKLFATHEGYGLRLGLTLETITPAIGKQIKQRGHQMPLEYAIGRWF